MNTTKHTKSVILLLCAAAMTIALTACNPSINRVEQGATANLITNLFGPVSPQNVQCDDSKPGEAGSVAVPYGTVCRTPGHTILVASSYAFNNQAAGVTTYTPDTGGVWSQNSSWSLINGTWQATFIGPINWKPNS